MKGPSPFVRRALTVVFVAVAVFGFVYSIVDAWRDTNGRLPSVPRFVLAAVLWGCGLVASSFAWSWIVGDRRFQIRAGFVVSQLGKYVPGGILQAAGQVRLAKGHGVAVRRSVVSFMVMAVVQVSVGGVSLLALGITWSDGPTWVRGLCGFGGLVALVLLDRRWMAFVLLRVPRTREDLEESLASQRAILGAALALLFALACGSGGYSILLAGFGRAPQPALVMSTFVVAWTVGFIAVPIPSGIGIREAVIAAILHGTLSSSISVAASVYHRFAVVIAEGCLALAFLPGLRRSSGGRTTPDETTPSETLP